MTDLQKNKMKRIVLVTLLVIVSLLVLRQYMPMVELPTDSRIEDEMARLKSLRGDLAVTQKMNSDWQKEVAELRGKSGLFWVRKRPTLPVEQEVLEEFNNIARLASVNIQSREARLVKNNNANYIQEVELRMDMRSVSMREVTRLMKELDEAKREFRWASCKIDPDNVQKPTGVKLSGRLRAFVLTEEATRILGGDVHVDAPETAGSKSGGVRSGARSRAASRRTTSSRSAGGALK